MTQRIETLRAMLDELQVDAFLVTNEINVRYLTGFTGDSSFLLVTPTETMMLSDGRYEIQLKNECPEIGALIRPPSQKMAELLEAAIRSRSSWKRIGLESAQVTVADYRDLNKRSPQITWVETSSVVENLRMVKDASEIATIRKAVDIAERSFLSMVPLISPKWSERAIAHEIESRMRFLGAESASFKPIIAFDSAGALPHYQPAEVFMPSRGSLLFDWGAKFQGYASDITRTLAIGAPSPDFERAYNAVLESQLAAIAAIRPGADGRDVDKTARDVIVKAGLGDKFNHGLGHGIGLQIHESPRMSANCEYTLAPGMIVTVEPGVYLADQYGIRIEDDVLVTDTGCEVLSTLAKGLDDCRLVL